MPTLWIPAEFRRRADDSHCRVVVVKCSLNPHLIPESGRYGPRECHYLGQIKATIKSAAAHLLAHTILWAEPGDIIISNGLSKPGMLGADIKRLLTERQITFYSLNSNPEDWNLRKECREMLKNAVLIDLPVLPYYEPSVVTPKYQHQIKPKPAIAGPPPEISVPTGETVTYSPTGVMPEGWLACDITIAQHQPDGLAGYAVCRITKEGTFQEMASGVMRLADWVSTVEAETRALEIACDLAERGDGVVCDIMTTKAVARLLSGGLPHAGRILGLIDAKRLSLALAYSPNLRLLHGEAHRLCREALARGTPLLGSAPQPESPLPLNATPSLWVTCVLSCDDTQQVVGIFKGEKDAWRDPSFGVADIQCAYRFRMAAGSAMEAGPHVLSHLLDWVGRGDTIIADSFARPGPLWRAMRRSILHRNVTVYSIHSDNSMRRLHDNAMVIVQSWPLEGLPLLGAYDTPLSHRPAFLCVPEGGALPVSWLASDISMAAKAGGVAGYAICRGKESGGFITEVETGALRIRKAGASGEAEMKAARRACQLADPGEGIVCDVFDEFLMPHLKRSGDPVDQEILRLVTEKRLVLATPTRGLLRAIHKDCHRLSRQHRMDEPTGD